MATRPEDEIYDWHSHAWSGRYLLDSVYKRKEIIAIARKVDVLRNKLSTEDSEAQAAVSALHKALKELDEAERLSSHYREQALQS